MAQQETKHSPQNHPKILPKTFKFDPDLKALLETILDQSILKITKRRPREAPDHQEASKRRKKPPQRRPKSFQNLPNSTPNRFKRPLGSHVGPMLLKSWISNTRKNDQEAPKRGPRPPRGGQETPQSVPNPSQMEPETLPNPIFKRYSTLYSLIPILNRFFVDFSLFF